jgi:hypothetical protein
MSVNVGMVVATTLKASLADLADQIYVNTRLLSVLYKQPGFRKEQRGGEKITAPVRYQQNTNTKWMNSTTQYSIAAQDPYDEAEFQWRMIGTTIPILEEYEVKCRAEYQIIDLVETLQNDCVESLKDSMNAMMFNDGSDGLAPVGLQAIVKTTGTYGGIPRSGNTWWQGTVNDTAEVFSISRMDSLFNTASANRTSPNVFVTTTTLLEKYENDARQFININQLRNADLGFETVKYKGMPFFWDGDCPSGEVYGLNTKYLKLVCDPDREYKMADKIQMQQPAYVLPVRWWGNLVCNGPRYQFAMRNKTAS